MFIKLTFKPADNKDIIISHRYHSLLQGFIYSLMPNDVAEIFHNSGFKSDNGRTYKLFTFSNIFSKQKREYQKNKRVFIFKDNIFFFISMPFKKYALDMVKKLNKFEEFYLDDNRLILDSYEKYEYSIQEKEIIVKCLSPITIYSTFTTITGKKKTYYYNPRETEFAELIQENAKKKFQAY